MGANSSTNVTSGDRDRTNGQHREDGMRHMTWVALLLCIGCSAGPEPKPGLTVPTPSPTHVPAAKVYVVLWFDTEDYLSPRDDDASLHLAKFLTAENIKA